MKTGTSLSRKRDQRNLLVRNLATSVILYESITTTEAKARAVQPMIDRIMRIAQGEDKLHAKRQLMAYLLDEKAVTKVLNELVGRFGDKKSGFTRRFHLGYRTGDAASQVLVQLTKTVLLEEKATKKVKEATDKNAAGEEPQPEGASHE